jgi:hypothetical protein
MVDGKLVYQAADDEKAFQNHRNNIAYAKQRWGCTLFYVNSTATSGRPFYPDVSKPLRRSFPMCC